MDRSVCVRFQILYEFQSIALRKSEAQFVVEKHCLVIAHGVVKSITDATKTTK